MFARSGTGGSGSCAERVTEAQFVDDLNLDVNVDLDGDEVQTRTDTGSEKKNVELNLMNKEEDELLLDYDFEPEFFETEEKLMTYVAQSKSAEGDVIELCKANMFKKVEEPVKAHPTIPKHG